MMHTFSNIDCSLISLSLSPDLLCRDVDHVGVDVTLDVNESEGVNNDKREIAKRQIYFLLSRIPRVPENVQLLVSITRTMRLLF